MDSLGHSFILEAGRSKVGINTTNLENVGNDRIASSPSLASLVKLPPTIIIVVVIIIIVSTAVRSCFFGIALPLCTVVHSPIIGALLRSRPCSDPDRAQPVSRVRCMSHEVAAAAGGAQTILVAPNGNAACHDLVFFHNKQSIGTSRFPRSALRRIEEPKETAHATLSSNGSVRFGPVRFVSFPVVPKDSDHGVIRNKRVTTTLHTRSRRVLWGLILPNASCGDQG